MTSLDTGKPLRRTQVRLTAEGTITTRIRQRVKALTPRAGCHRDLRETIAQLNPILRGVDRFTVRARPLNWMWSTVGRVNADGTFELKGVIGSVVLSIWTLTGDWTLKTVEHNGRNLADAPIDVRHGETLNGVRVVLTNRPTHVRGGLVDEKQQPAEGTVVIFPEDTSRWREDSRTVRAARPDQKGEFSIKGMPPGKYLIAALDYVQDGQVRPGIPRGAAAPR